MSPEFKEELSAEEIRAYWTPERMAAAEPDDDAPETMPEPDAEFVGPTGEPEEIPGYDPTRSAEGREIGAPLQMAPVFPPTVFPYCTIGKLFYTWGTAQNKRNSTASGYVIGPDTVLTAGHALWREKHGGASRNHLFVPAFMETSPGTSYEPYGNWAALMAYVMDPWQEFENWSYDVGILWVGFGGRDGKQRIKDVIGFLGQKYNQPLGPWTQVGYPPGSNEMYADPGTYTRSRDEGRIVCKTGALGKGSSGGPWLLSGAQYFGNGVTSFHKYDSTGSPYTGSPYFNTTVLNFIKARLAPSDQDVNPRGD
jgi:V8-like Glu-specific endopeptidase